MQAFVMNFAPCLYSITMTTVSSIVGLGMMPLLLFIYQTAFGFSLQVPFEIIGKPKYTTRTSCLIINGFSCYFSACTKIFGQLFKDFVNKR